MHDKKWSTATLVVGHTISDIYQGAVPALVPFFVAERHFGYLAASGIAFAAAILSSVAQPLFGLLTDRKGLPWLVPVGMIIAGAGIGLSGLSNSYELTWLAIALSGLGIAAYHPESARLARAATAGSHVGMSWFSLGGNLGFALGPVLVTPVLTAAGLTATPLLAIPAVLGSLVTVAILRSLSTASIKVKAALLAKNKDDWFGFSRLTVVVTCRSIMTFGMGTFLALYVEQRLHANTIAGEVALFMFFGFGALGTLLGGHLATHWERVRTMRYSYVAAVPALLGLIFVPGPVIYLFVALVAVTNYVPFSLHVTLGQDYLPNRIGTASGVTLGLALSVGGLLAPALGKIAETVSLQAALTALLVPSLVSLLIAHTMVEPTNLVAKAALVSAK